MNNIEVVTVYDTEHKVNLFGIFENGIEVVPTIHYTKEHAIEEWVYFERLNFERKPHKRFLPKVKNYIEIAKIKKQLYEN
jgi:hypothetical protein